MSLNFIQNLISGFFSDSQQAERFVVFSFVILGLIVIALMVYWLRNIYQFFPKAFYAIGFVILVFGMMIGILDIVQNNGLQNQKILIYPGWQSFEKTWVSRWHSLADFLWKRAGVENHVAFNKTTEEIEREKNKTVEQSNSQNSDSSEVLISNVNEGSENITDRLILTGANGEIVSDSNSVSAYNLKNDSVTSEKIVDHAIKNKDIDGGSIDSRTIRDGSIQDRDISNKIRMHVRSLTIEDGLDVSDAALFRNNLTVEGNFSFSGSLDFGTNLISSENMTGDWNLNGGNLSGVGDISSINISGGTYNGNTILTGEGVLDLGTYALKLLGNSQIDQDLLTTSSPIFNNLNLDGSLTIDENTLFVDASSNHVGIGKSNPLYALDVAGGVNAESLYVNGIVLNGTSLAMTKEGTLIGQTLYWDGDFWTYSNNIFNDGVSVGIGTATPSYTLDVAGDGHFSGGLTIEGGIIMGTTDTDYLVVNGTLNSHLVPASNSVYDLGSPAYYYRNIYANTLIANNISAGGTDISGTTAETLALNTDNATTDSENSYLIFTRGTITPNGTLGWNSSSDRFEFNQDLIIQDETPGTGSTLFSIKAGAGQGTDNLMEWLDHSGSVLGFIDYDGNIVTSGSLTPSGNVYLADGLVSSPSLSFSSDTNSGLYRIGNDKISLITGGIVGNGLTIDSSGSVGIGTVSPGSKLDIRGGINSGTNGTEFSVSSLGVITSGTWNGISLSDDYIDNNLTLSGAILSGNTNTINLGSDANGDIYYRNSSGYLDRLAVGNSGTVLQGGSLPAWSTASYPSTAATSGALLMADGSNWTSSTATFADTYGINQLLYASGANVITGLSTGNNSILITNGGGTPSWSSISFDNFAQYALLAGRSGGQTLYGGTGSGDNLTLASTSDGTKGKIIFGSDSVYDETSDRLGIGTTIPGSKLSVSGGGLALGTSYAAVSAGDGNALMSGSMSIGSSSIGAKLYVDQNSAADVINFLDGGNSIFKIADGGEITVGGAIAYSAVKPKRSIILTSSGATVPTTGGATQTKVDGASSTYYVLDFNDSTDNASFWQWTMPDSYDGGNISATFYWESDSVSGDVVWAAQTAGVAPDNSESIDPILGVAQTVSSSASVGAGSLVSATVSSWNPSWSPGDYVTFKVYRDADAGSDTMSGNARLMKVKIEYSVSSESD